MNVLTQKNKQFLDALCDGSPIMEAFEAAKYRGLPHAAYMLRSHLSRILKHELSQIGIDDSFVVRNYPLSYTDSGRPDLLVPRYRAYRDMKSKVATLTTA